MNKFRSDENAELVKENEGFFVLKLVASEIHFLRLGARDSCIAMGRSFATDLRQRVINSSLEAAEEARSDHP